MMLLRTNISVAAGEELGLGKHFKIERRDGSVGDRLKQGGLGPQDELYMKIGYLQNTKVSAPGFS